MGVRCFGCCSGTLAGCGSATGAGDAVTGCAGAGAGDAVLLDFAPPGGGGRGAMPTLDAAAAAAEEYFRCVPVGNVGKGAGLMVSAAFPLTLLGRLACNVESAGNGDFSCTLGRLTAFVSDTELDFVFAPGALLVRTVSCSGWSSCML